MIEQHSDHYAERRVAWLGESLPTPGISFEFFPPKTDEAEIRLWKAVDKLADLEPSYVSVTCGAGGNPAEGTAALVKRLRDEAGRVTAADYPGDALDVTYVYDDPATPFSIGRLSSLARDGATIYPSRLLDSTPRYDSGALFVSGQDPQQ